MALPELGTASHCLEKVVKEDIISQYFSCSKVIMDLPAIYKLNGLITEDIQGLKFMKKD